jgi:general secretion pathway protein G
MHRRGFTAIELLVVLAVLVVLAAIVVPQVASRARAATGPAVLSSTATIADAIGQFKADTRRYPGQIRWLVSLDGTPTDICGDPIPAGLLSRWGGPYIQQHVPAAGLPAGDARILNALLRADAETVSSLILRATGVTQQAAERIEREMDGDADFTAGTIRWTPGAGGQPGTLEYHLPIRGC